nr:MAG: hypothetical protein CM15mV30_0060 [uncultured marine virus]
MHLILNEYEILGYEIEGKKTELQTAYGYVQDTVMGITTHHVDWLYTQSFI